MTVYGLLSGVNGAVTVTGPAGYTAAVKATTTLTGLAPGTYTVTAAPTRGTASVVDTAYVVTNGGGPVSVSAGTTSTSSVTYDLVPGSGKLWIADTASGIDGFTNAQLTGPGGSITPSVQVQNANGPAGLALDASGNVWAGITSGSELVEYTTTQLVAGGSVPPSITIKNNTTDNSLIRPLDLAFDPQGNLWVSNCNGNLEMFTPSQLTTNNSSPAPNATLTSTTCAVGMTFDAQGNLWFSEPHASPPDIVEFTAAQLAAAAGTTSSPSPNVVLTSTSFTSATSNTPSGLAFDGGGNLWVANASATTSGDAIWMFPKSQLITSGTGTLTPSVNLQDNGSGDLASSYYLAFDNSGNLWVSSTKLVEIASSDLTGGNPTPAVAITIGSGLTQGAYPQLAFDPPPPTP